MFLMSEAPLYLKLNTFTKTYLLFPFSLFLTALGSELRGKPASRCGYCHACTPTP